MSRTTWRLLRTQGLSPELNMGLDEALLEDVDSPDTLRLYTWDPDTLSLGYFQRFAEVPECAQASAVVRRLTGGGAIHHTNELTFAFTCAKTHPLYRGPVADSYARVHRAIAHALAGIGVEATLRGDARLVSERDASAMCFHRSTDLDLCWDGRKGVGSAQRRRRDRVLHHGSIKLGTSALEVGVASLPLGLGELEERVLQAFGERLGLDLEPTEVREAEWERARALGPRYSGPAFVRRR